MHDQSTTQVKHPNPPYSRQAVVIKEKFNFKWTIKKLSFHFLQSAQSATAARKNLFFQCNKHLSISLLYHATIPCSEYLRRWKKSNQTERKPQFTFFHLTRFVFVHCYHSFFLAGCCCCSCSFCCMSLMLQLKAST